MEFRKDTENNKLFVIANEEELEVGNLIEMNKKIKNIDTETISAVISFSDEWTKRELKIDREEYLYKPKLINYMKTGMDVTENNAKYLVEYLRQEEKSVSASYEHSTLGYSKFEEKEIFKLYNCIGIESTYVGNMKIKPKGSKEAWLNMFNNIIKKRGALHLIIAVALSAVILGRIGIEKELDSLIFHVVGNSTTGKSTALKLAISIFGFPNVKQNGLFTTYNSTENALIKQLSGIVGVPIAFDEISMANTNDFTNLIYKLANGTDKARLNRDCSMQDKGKWLTTILSNGEKSMVENSRKNAGVNIRVLEAKDISWTSSSKQADDILKIIGNNYGCIGFEFAKQLMKIPKNELINRYDECSREIVKIFKNKFEVDSMTKRRANKFATILLAGYLFQEFFNVEFNIELMKKYFLRIEKDSLFSRDFKKSAINYIKQYVDKNFNKFQYSKNKAGYNDLGIIEDKKDSEGVMYKEVQITQEVFNSMMTSGGFEDGRVVLKELKSNNLLSCDKDRYTRKRIGKSGIKVQFIVIKLYDEEKKNSDKNPVSS